MASCSGESVEAAERRKGFWWSGGDTPLLNKFLNTSMRSFSEMYIERRKLGANNGRKSKFQHTT